MYLSFFVFPQVAGDLLAGGVYRPFKFFFEKGLDGIFPAVPAVFYIRALLAVFQRPVADHKFSAIFASLAFMAIRFFHFLLL